MRINVLTATPKQLDWLATGLVDRNDELREKLGRNSVTACDRFSPTTNTIQAHVIANHEALTNKKFWELWPNVVGNSKEELSVAATRCYVISVIGNVANVPEECC